MKIQAAASTAEPRAILTHMVRPALGEMFRSIKKLSRRRRRTLGNEDAVPWSPAVCCGAASDGTRSSTSGFRLITPSGVDFTRGSAISPTSEVIVARKLEENQGAPRFNPGQFGNHRQVPFHGETH